jgi:hypothetical protein
MERDVPQETAERVLDKVRGFMETLDEDERAVFAALVAPGVAQAYRAEEDVVGFGEVGWSPNALPQSLVTALRERGVRVEGL